MKKVIDGKLYNTATAECLAEWSYSNPSDFNYVSEALYRTRKGQYFLFGEGGAMSKYAESCGENSWGGGSDIVPMDCDEAKAWVEEHGTADDYINAFGEPEEA